MRLSELISGAANDAEITSVTADSRLVKPRALFVAIPGTVKDGTQFIPQAREKGAAAVVAEKGDADVIVDDARAALATIAANFYGRPAEKLKLVGVTGTSGKTTTTRMIESIFDASGDPAGLIGTIEYRAGDEKLVADRTTPDATLLHEWFAKMVDAGVRHAVMEVSSHALALKRTYGIHFAAAVFTNLSREHFDFHKNFEEYFAAKRILFDQIDRSRRTAVVNIDDEYGRRLKTELGDTAITFGRGSEAEICPGDDFAITVDGLRGTVITPRGEIRVESQLLGQPNLYNWLGAIGAALVLDIPSATIEAGIRNLRAVRGRFERVDVRTGFSPSEARADDARAAKARAEARATFGPTVIVDYAHKPDALEKLLHAVRDIAPDRRIVIIFGCGGDRDRGKRPQMGEIAGRLADDVIVTSDNPRSEEPRAIIDEITQGIRGRDFRAIADRREAIAGAIEEAGDDDVIVIAGKGHETYQVVGDQVIHFDDREEAELALKNRHGNRS